jgi:hypothetical protein
MLVNGNLVWGFGNAQGQLANLGTLCSSVIAPSLNGMCLAQPSLVVSEAIPLNFLDHPTAIRHSVFLQFVMFSLTIFLLISNSS